MQLPRVRYAYTEAAWFLLACALIGTGAGIVYGLLHPAASPTR